MASPTDRKYSESHEWHKVDGDTLVLGISRFAVDALTDITYVQMKKVGTRFKAGDVVGEVESVKTTSDIYAFVGGEITEVNGALTDNPGLINEDPYGKGWLLKAKITDASGLAKLMDGGSYDKAHP